VTDRADGRAADLVVLILVYFFVDEPDAIIQRHAGKRSGQMHIHWRRWWRVLC